jgi:hypothetical protein
LKEVCDSLQGLARIDEVLLGAGSGRVDISADITIRGDSDKAVLGLDLDPHNAYP